MDRKIDQSLDPSVDVSITIRQWSITISLFCLFHEYVHTFLTILLIDRYFLIKYRKEEN